MQNEFKDFNELFDGETLTKEEQELIRELKSREENILEQ
jgi:hypothetical protein